MTVLTVEEMKALLQFAFEAGVEYQKYANANSAYMEHIGKTRPTAFEEWYQKEIVGKKTPKP